MRLVAPLFAVCLSAFVLACGGKDTGGVTTPPDTGMPAATAEEVTKTKAGDGYLRIAWRLQTQEDVYGFYVYRADSEDGPWEQANDLIVPGHGTTALPQEYAFVDSGLTIGQKYYYYVTEVTLSGAENKITPVLGAEAKPRSYYVEKGYLSAEGEDTTE